MLRSLTLFLVVMTALSAAGEDWPQWRGPRGDGTSTESDVPTEWNVETGQGIVWKVPVPGVGHSSPIVHGNRLFVTSCLLDSTERVLICFDVETGEKRWQRTVIRAPLEKKHKLNSFASGTPTTDGESVYATFLEPSGSSDGRASPGKIVVAAYDVDGNHKWTVRPGEFSSIHGYCSSPLLFESMVIVNGDHDGNSYVVALNRETGDTQWKSPRRHRTRSYVTPLLRNIDGQPHIVFSGSKQITSLDPRDGSTWWTVDGPTEQFVASMVYDGKKFYMTAGFPTHHVMGIRADGRGDITDTHVAWHSTVAKCYVPSPVVVGKRLFVADDRGIANCFDTVSGERIWRERLGRHYSASLVTAAGLVYFVDDDGACKIVRPANAPEIVAKNPLGERCFSSPAISEGQIFLRGEKHLFRIGKR